MKTYKEDLNHIESLEVVIEGELVKIEKDQSAAESN